MARLSAFVGHSFLDSDGQVVDRVLKMLDSIKTLMPDFEWEHALAAEPKVLSQKVKEKMQGKNLFIGICTAKEHVIDTKLLKRRSWWTSDKFVADSSKFQAKTSDWIIQEIGMAVGRDMHIVLLIEDGVRSPGGLQGDLEYISFSRERPEAVFDKLANMLRTLVPQAVKGAEVQPSVAPVEVSKDDEESRFILDYLTPTASWTPEEYALRYRFALLVDEERAAREIAESFDRTAFSSDPGAQATFRAAQISARAELYKGEWVAPLQNLARQYPNTAGPFIELARRFEEAGDHALAATNYEMAVQFENAADKRVRLLVDAATQRSKCGDSASARELISKASDIMVANPQIEAEGMLKLATYWQSIGNNEMFTACSERALELKPDSAQARFDLAYGYSKAGLENHALYHYGLHLRMRDNADAWNNLGVSAVSHRLLIRGIEAYQTAHRAGNTLATSNLAYALLQAGFLSEATALCVEGLKRPNPDPRLLEAKAQCDRARAVEGEKEEKVLEGTTRRRSVLRRMGRSSIIKLERALPRLWEGPDCDLTATFNGSELTLAGSYTHRFRGVLASAFTGTQQEIEAHYKVVYSGVLCGHAFIGKVRTTSDRPSARTSLLGGDDALECIGSIDEDLTTFDLLVNDSDRIAIRAKAVD